MTSCAWYTIFYAFQTSLVVVRPSRTWKFIASFGSFYTNKQKINLNLNFIFIFVKSTHLKKLSNYTLKLDSSLP